MLVFDTQGTPFPTISYMHSAQKQWRFAFFGVWKSPNIPLNRTIVRHRGMTWKWFAVAVVDDHLLAKLLNSHPAWHFLTGLESELLGWHCRWCGKWLLLGKLESEVRRFLRSILQLVLLQLWINKTMGFWDHEHVPQIKTTCFVKCISCLQTPFLNITHHQSLAQLSPDLYGDQGACIHAKCCCHVVDGLGEKLFRNRSLIGIFESLLSFTKISVEVYSNVMRCVSTIKCLSTIFLYINHHQLRFLQELRLFMVFHHCIAGDFGVTGCMLWHFCCNDLMITSWWSSWARNLRNLWHCWWTKFPAIYVFGMVNQKPWCHLESSWLKWIWTFELIWPHLVPVPLRFDGTPHGSQGSNLMCLRSVEKSRQLQLLFDLEKRPVFVVMLLVYPGHPS